MSKRKRGGGGGGGGSSGGGSRWKFSMICANNINRSMEGHKVLRDAGLRVNSYGAGRHVRIPHETKGALTKNFGEMVYADVLEELRAENEPFYKKLGLLDMLERDMGIKARPQRWQDESSRTLATLDVVICYEERIFDAVVEDLQCREAFSAKPVHVVCIDIKDDAENAAMGGQIGLALAQQCEASANLEDDIADICERFEKEHEKKDIKMMWTVHYL